jgi:CheY-like chemotaxis protein
MQRGARSFNLKPLKNEALSVLFTDIATFNDRKRKKVLVIEDNELDSSQIAKMLANGELISIEIASTGKEGLEMIENSIYDCIIVDYMLPDISGMDFIREVNNIKKMKLTPVIVYSAKDFSGKEKTQLKQYANRVLLKDVNHWKSCSKKLYYTFI